MAAELAAEAITPKFRHPSLLGTGTVKESAKPSSPFNVTGGTSVMLAADGTVTWTLPLAVSVRLGTGTVAPFGIQSPVDTPATPIGGEAGFQFKPEFDYSNRRGYNPRFLGTYIALPKLNADQKKIAAVNQRRKPGENKNELKYEHFSIVMNGERRLPFFTACNIDGASVVKITRKTGNITVEEPDEESLAEAYEKWYDDLRIRDDQRSRQDLYDHPDLNKYQRGHLVKRTDPSWGDAERGYRAQSDTFHFTNSAPQHQGFNPIASRWAGVENWITDESDDADLRVSVFTGPVFGADDPPLSYIMVPRQFWKVVVWSEDGEMQAIAVLADQSDLVSGSESAAEDLSDLPDSLEKVKQISVRQVEQLTGLSFGKVRDFDLLEAGPESGSGGEREIHRWSDFVIHKTRQASA
jgi:endonuclease G